MNARRSLPLGCIVLLAISSLAVGVIAAPAQTAAPHTTPQGVVVLPYSPRLTPPAAKAIMRPSPGKHRSGLCDGVRRGSPLDQGYDIFDNGPLDGQTLGWTINFGFSVSDSMQICQNATVTGFNFWIWLIPDDTLTSAEVQIGAAAFGNELFDQTLSFTASNCFTNGLGYNVCLESSPSFSGPNINGTAWVTLSNAIVPSGDPAYWDMNNGPSQAQENMIGTIPSESFTMIGTGYPQDQCVPEQSGAFSVIHDFTGNGDGSIPIGVAIDRSGNLYGPTFMGPLVQVYKLAQAGSGWVFNTLYNFIGGGGGGSPQGVIVGPHDLLYGAAYGGIWNCHYYGGERDCGLIFQLRPSPTTCPAISCSWTETVLYNFTGPTDAWGGYNLVSDQAGNLYGVSQSGGAEQQGAVFELTPTLGGWAESILYSFTGTSDGGSPTTIIVGNDGKLYGMAGLGGAYDGGVVFQLAPSGNGWMESVLYNLPANQNMDTNPHSLLQDSAGNLFGIYDYTVCCGNWLSLIFELSPSNGNWVFTELLHGNESWDQDLFPNMILDAAGNLLGTETGSAGGCIRVSYADIFELTRANGWQYSNPVGWDHTFWDPNGSLALDAQGNLYGTTQACGSYNQGTVWELQRTP